MTQTAERRWRAALAEWALPGEIVANAPVAPWSHPVADFAIAPNDIARETVSEVRALEALPQAGRVLDVGCGGGRASFALLPRAGRLIGVDEDAGMLDAFSATATALDVEFEVLHGRWPDIAADTPGADLVVSHHTFFNVPDLAAFADALAAHASRRVVVELPFNHPLSFLNEAWRHFWSLERPEEPTAELALQVVRECGLDARLEVWTAPWQAGRGDRDSQAEQLTRRLCLSQSRTAEVADFLRTHPLAAERAISTIWWDL